jgi:type I restriction enzyme R subunit
LTNYSIKESIEDETTVPIKHVLTPSSLTVPADRLDEEFFELAATEGITDIEELNRVLDHAVGLRTFLKADERVKNVAEFVANHFKESVQPLGYRAFLVAVDREACAKYKKALNELLPPECTEAIYTANAADVIDRPLVAQLQLSEEREDDVRDPFYETRQGSQNSHCHRQTAHWLRRSHSLLHVPRQADAGTMFCSRRLRG